MRKLFNSTLIVALLVVSGVLGAIVIPSSVNAGAGDGGSGGQAGCEYVYSTCAGAVWRYYRTSSDAYNIQNVREKGDPITYTTVRNCGSTAGGFFAYVLVNRDSPNDETKVRSWQIGPANGNPGNRSEFFGGWTNYRIFSRTTDPLPTNPTNGQYSWYSAKKAFDQTVELGQNNGFSWDGGSKLGWFCYRGSEFSLTTALSGNRQSAEAGATVTLNPSVINAGPTQSSSAQWQVTRRVLPVGGSIPGAGASSSAPTAYYGAGTTVIKPGTQVFQLGTTAIPPFGTVMPDASLDQRVCYALSVQPRSHASSEWYHSQPFCIIVAKSPKIQATGGDVIVGSGSQISKIVTTVSRKSVSDQNRTFGSWGEYAVAANGRIVGMASGAGYSGGPASGIFCNVSFLTIANAGTDVCADATQKGSYTFNPSLPNISGRFISSDTTNLGAAATLDVADPSAGSGIYTASGTLTLTNSGVVEAGEWIVINAPDADVIIADDLLYTDADLTSISRIPQVILIADTISIQSNVTRVDAWLAATGATGTINTCGEISNPAQSSSPLTAVRCTDRLTFNGPVIAKKLFLYRTAGAGIGSASGDPAEVFNLRPDAYLWAAHYQSSTGRIQTVFTKELPPRF